MEVTKPWSNYNTNKYYIITRDKETNEWKFFKEIVGHTVLWKDEPSRYGMTKSRAIEVLNIVKNLTNEDEPIEPEIPTEPSEPDTPTNPTDGEPTNTEPTEPNTNTDPTDTPTEPSESDNDTPTSTDGETPTEGNNNGETSSTSDTETNIDPETNVEDPETPQSEEPTTPTDPTTTVEEPQYKIITISSVTYNSEEAPIFDDDDYNKLKSTLIYIDSTYPNTEVHVVTAESDTGKSIFYFYLEDELTWFLELRTNIVYSLVSNVTKLDDIKELL